MLTSEQTAQIHKALNYLADRCDGANALDGAGFNKFDSDFGKSLARSPQLSEAQALRALKMMRKYRGQLESGGIVLDYSWDAQPVEERTNGSKPAAEAPKVPVLTVASGMVYISFPNVPSEPCRTAMKSRANAQWVPSLPNKPWATIEKNLPVFQAIAQEFYGGYEEGKVTEAIKADAKQSDKLIEVKIVGDELHVTFPHWNGRKERVARLKNLRSGFRWDPNSPDKHWHGPVLLAGELVNLYPEGEFSQEVIDLANRNQKLSAMSNKVASNFEVEGLTGTLRPFQKAGVEFLVEANYRGLIADDMGLGKTIQSIAIMQYQPQMRPAIIVVPNGVKINWEREINKWMTTKERIVQLSGTKPYKLGWLQGTIFIINYDILSKWVVELLAIEPQLLIADESHYAKNQKSGRGKAALALAKEIEHVILLTGTPVMNRPEELWAQLQMLNDKEWNNKFFNTYRYKYCYNPSPDNLKELHERTRPYILRRKKTEVLKELPDKTRTTILVEFTNDARNEYNRYQAELKKLIAEKGAFANQLAAIEYMKQAAARGKMPAAINWIENFLQGENKLVVFATHKFVIDQLMEKFAGVAVKVDGSVTGQKRDDAVQAFQTNDKVRLFVGNIQAAGVGITLTAASDALFIEFPWTPSACVQAEDRIYRIGQKNAVTIWYLAGLNTYEEEIVDLIERKREIADMIHDGAVSDESLSVFKEWSQKVQVGTD